MVVLKDFFFTISTFGKDRMLKMFTLGECGVLKGLILDNFYLERVLWS